jgi:hypothetical protein
VYNRWTAYKRFFQVYVFLHDCVALVIVVCSRSHGARVGHLSAPLFWPYWFPKALLALFPSIVPLFGLIFAEKTYWQGDVGSGGAGRRRGVGGNDDQVRIPESKGIVRFQLFTNVVITAHTSTGEKHRLPTRQPTLYFVRSLEYR